MGASPRRGGLIVPSLPSIPVPSPGGLRRSAQTETIKVLAVGQPTPINPAEYVFIALDTHTPYTLDFPGTDGGKNAHYILRWANGTGARGPWSETVTATIGV